MARLFATAFNVGSPTERLEHGWYCTTSSQSSTAMSVSDVDKAKVKLITLLNVASARNASKRKTGEDWHEIARRAKKSKAAAAEAGVTGRQAAGQGSGLVEVEAQADAEDDEQTEQQVAAPEDQDDDEDENG